MKSLLVMRPAQLKDVKTIIQLAKLSSIGLTSLPHEPNSIKAKVARSVAAFKAKISQPKNELYFFVLEDPKTKSIVGTAAIDAAVGFGTPFYSYKVSTITRVCRPLNIQRQYDHLNLVNDYQGKTELCTLFLLPKYRANGNGILLSLGRFLFMAQHPERFTETVFAEMRGVTDRNGRSAFWDGLGKHFFAMSFAEADHLSAVTNKQFIADLMPRSTIYTSLLPKRAQAVIGKVHHESKSAYRLLQAQGFEYNNSVDIFDAGPTLECKFKYIKAINHSEIVSVSKIAAVTKDPIHCLVATTGSFRATQADLHFNGDEITLDPITANLLQIKCGAELRILRLKNSGI